MASSQACKALQSSAPVFVLGPAAVATGPTVPLQPTGEWIELAGAPGYCIDSVGHVFSKAETLAAGWVNPVPTTAPTPEPVAKPRPVPVLSAAPLQKQSVASTTPPATPPAEPSGAHARNNWSKKRSKRRATVESRAAATNL